MSSLAAAVESCKPRHSSTCCFSGQKILCIRSTPMARLSSSEKCFECFAKTCVYTPGTMFPDFGLSEDLGASKDGKYSSPEFSKGNAQSPQCQPSTVPKEGDLDRIEVSLPSPSVLGLTS